LATRAATSTAAHDRGCGSAPATVARKAGGAAGTGGRTVGVGATGSAGGGGGREAIVRNVRATRGTGEGTTPGTGDTWRAAGWGDVAGGATPEPHTITGDAARVPARTTGGDAGRLLAESPTTGAEAGDAPATTSTPTAGTGGCATAATDETPAAAHTGACTPATAGAPAWNTNDSPSAVVSGSAGTALTGSSPTPSPHAGVCQPSGSTASSASITAAAAAIAAPAAASSAAAVSAASA